MNFLDMLHKKVKNTSSYIHVQISQFPEIMDGWQKDLQKNSAKNISAFVVKNCNPAECILSDVEYLVKCVDQLRRMTFAFTEDDDKNVDSKNDRMIKSFKLYVSNR